MIIGNNKSLKGFASWLSNTASEGIERHCHVYMRFQPGPQETSGGEGGETLVAISPMGQLAMLT